ncbi:MAG: hypothetical protein ACK559_08500, partial [bacterium]
SKLNTYPGGSGSTTLFCMSAYSFKRSALAAVEKNLIQVCSLLQECQRAQNVPIHVCEIKLA